ncbi:hypothetical protein BH23GEM7_BH23GEM7_29670 [soil metagenome]|nr:hypothetical protein [Gemmatimonadota bacterium]
MGTFSAECAELDDFTGNQVGGSVTNYDLPVEAEDNVTITLTVCTLPVESQVCPPFIQRSYPIFEGQPQ